MSRNIFFQHAGNDNKFINHINFVKKITMKKIALLLSLMINFLVFAQAGIADNDFNPQITGSYGFNNLGYPISKILLQPDGKAIVCGRFTTFRGVSRNRIVRLNTDGS